MCFTPSLDMFLQDETTAKSKLQNVAMLVRIAYRQRFSGPRCCLCPHSQIRLGDSDSAPKLAFPVLSLGRECLDLLPTGLLPRVQKKDAQHKVLQHKGARADSLQQETIQRFLCTFKTAKVES